MGAEFSRLLAKRLAGAPPDVQKYRLVATLQDCLPAGAQATLVGGSLVELLTMGAVTSLDVDLVADHRAVKQLLEGAGFREGPKAMFRHPDYEVLVNVVNDHFVPSERMTTYRYEGHTIRILSAEDCLIDRLNGARHWRDASDWERAIILARVLRDRLDLEHLRRRADEEGVREAVEEVLQIVA